MRTLRPAFLVAVVLLASCGGDSATEAERAPPSRLTGVITEVRTDGEDITGFELEAPSGRQEILIDPDRDYGFGLDHLFEHQRTGDPVVVDLETRRGDLYAVSIVDA
jgi:hypothetical protein